MTDLYLHSKLQQYLYELSTYYHTLQTKSIKHPNLKDTIQLVLHKIDLQASYLQDQLNQLQTKQFTQDRLKHKMTVIMNNYSKVLDEIHKVMNFEPMVEIRDRERERTREKKTKEGRMREFVEELNSQWMVGVLNMDKERRQGKKGGKEEKGMCKTKEIQQQQQLKPKSIRSIALQHLKLQTKQLYQTMLRMKTTLSVHKHPSINKQLQILKQQEKQLLTAVEDLKESNLFMKTEYQKLQKELQMLKRNRQIMIQNK